MKEAFIFDMDGTLFDTETVTREALRAVSHNHGEREDIDAFYPTTCGVTRADAEQLYKAFFGEEYPFSDRREEMRSWIKAYIDTHGIPIKTGATALLTYLKANGYKIALATSTERSSAEKHIQKAAFEPFFDATVCGNEVQHSKPHPEIFLTAAKKLGVCPENCYVVEDSYFGVEAGAAAGMRVFMIPDLNPPRDKEKALAYQIGNSLLDIIDCIRQ